VRPRRRRIYAAAAALVVAAAGTAATLLILDRVNSPREAGSPGSNEITAAAPWRLVIIDKTSPSKGCTVTVTNTDTGEPRVENVWGTKQFQMKTAGTFRWEADDSACKVFQRPGSGKAVLPFSRKAGEGDTDAFAAPKGTGTVTVQVLSFHGYGQCTFDLHDPADGQLLESRTVDKGVGSVRLGTNGRAQVYLADLKGCDIRLSAEP